MGSFRILLGAAGGAIVGLVGGFLAREHFGAKDDTKIPQLVPPRQPVPTIPGEYVSSVPAVPAPHHRDVPFLTPNNIIRSTPSTPMRRVSENFVLEYDSMNKNPRWVIEKLTYDSLQQEIVSSKARPFKEEPGLPSHIRAKLHAYTNSGYDRGHMAAARNHSFSESAWKDTFFLSNIAPQVRAGFNNGYWKKTEDFLRNLVNKKNSPFDEVYVVSGPLYLPQWVPNFTSDAKDEDPININANEQGEKTVTVKSYKESRKEIMELSNTGNGGQGSWRYSHPAIGAPLQWIAVPTHFFKVVAAYNKTKDSWSIAAFLMANTSHNVDKPLSASVVSVQDLEALSGLSFFNSFFSPQTVEDCEGKYEKGKKFPAGQLRQNLWRSLLEPQYPIASHTNIYQPLFVPNVLVDVLPSKKLFSSSENGAKPHPRVYHLCSVVTC